MSDHVVPSRRLTEAGARAVLDAARAEAAAMGVPQCIAVVDDGGTLLAFTRMDGARPASVEIALTKAISAATRRRPTASEGGGDALAQVRLALAAAPARVTGVGGGVPLVVGGEVVGAVGVSSSPDPAEDTRVAEAGAAALQG